MHMYPRLEATLVQLPPWRHGEGEHGSAVDINDSFSMKARYEVFKFPCILNVNDWVILCGHLKEKSVNTSVICSTRLETSENFS